MEQILKPEFRTSFMQAWEAHGKMRGAALHAASRNSSHPYTEGTHHTSAVKHDRVVLAELRIDDIYEVPEYQYNYSAASVRYRSQSTFLVCSCMPTRLMLRCHASITLSAESDGSTYDFLCFLLGRLSSSSKPSKSAASTSSGASSSSDSPSMSRSSSS